MADAAGDAGAYRAAVETLAAPVWRTQANELASNGLNFVKRRYGQGASISFQPLRYRVDQYTDGRATIQLWGMVIASGPKIRRLEESWITTSIQLSWVQNDWRASGQDSKAGPTPHLLSGQDAAAAAGLNDFQEFGRAPQP
jgi:hypothetical protein